MTRKWCSPIATLIVPVFGQTVRVSDDGTAREKMPTGTCLKTGSGRKFLPPIQTPQKVIAHAVVVIGRDELTVDTAAVVQIRRFDLTTA